MYLNTIGVIGAGVMGIDIATLLIVNNFNVVLIDNNKNNLEKAKNKVEKNYRLMSLFDAKDKNQHENITENIEFDLNLERLQNVDLIIENITENYEEKIQLHKELNNLINPEIILCANTSCIPITEIAEQYNWPKNIIGMHFMNPVTINNTVEVIKTKYTSQIALKKGIDFLKSISKISIIVSDSPGFVTNRLSHLFMNEAAYLILEKIAEPKQVDLLFKKGYGHKMGPLETADLIGIDTVVNSLNILYKFFKNSKFKCCPILNEMVAKGDLGRKTGKGFYNYD